MGYELFEIKWVQSIILFFSNLGWALYIIGVVVAVFECAIEYQSGRGSAKDTGINCLKGFLAVSLFTTIPVELYKLSITLSGQFSKEITGIDMDFTTLGQNMLSELLDAPTLSEAYNANMFAMFGGINPVMVFFILFMIGYAVVKVFFDSLKRGGILLIQISVGSLYMLSVPRGYSDMFVQWCKQVIALCLTAFLQILVLTAGLMTLKSNAMLGLGLMLSSTEIPRIAGSFGLDTSTKANLMGAVHTTSSVISTSRQLTQLVAK